MSHRRKQIPADVPQTFPEFSQTKSLLHNSKKCERSEVADLRRLISQLYELTVFNIFWIFATTKKHIWKKVAEKSSMPLCFATGKYRHCNHLRSTTTAPPWRMSKSRFANSVLRKTRQMFINDFFHQRWQSAHVKLRRRNSQIMGDNPYIPLWYKINIYWIPDNASRSCFIPLGIVKKNSWKPSKNQASLILLANSCAAHP